MEVTTAADWTRAKVAGGETVEVRHRPVATWFYLGQGYRTGEVEGERSFLVDVELIRSKVEAQ